MRGENGHKVWPLVGRGDVLERLASALQEEKGAVVAGPAGVGKSRVLSAVIEESRDDDVEVLEISGAQSAAAIPLAPLLQLIDFETDGDLANLVLAELNRRSRSKRLIIVVDDAQNLDDASAALLHQLVSSDVAKLLIGMRSGETAPVSVTSLWKDEQLIRIELQPLGRRQTNRLIELVLGTTSRKATDWLWGRSQGHPLFLRELILAAEAAGALREENGVTELVNDVPLSDRLIELIEQGLDRLNVEDVHGLVGLMLAQPLDPDSAESLVGARFLQTALAKGLAKNRGGLIELAHPLHGEAAALRLTSAEMHSLRRRTADLLAQVGGRDADVALLLLESQAPIDPSLLLDATREVLHLRQGPLAIRLASSLVDVDPSGEAWAQLGAAFAMNRDWVAADDTYRTAVTLVDDETQAASVWLSWIQSTFEYREDVTLARDLAAEAQTKLEGGAGQIAAAWHLRTRLFSEPMTPVLEGMQALNQLPHLDPSARRLLELDLAGCSWHAGRPNAGLTALSEGSALTDPDPVFRSRAMQVRNALIVWSKGFAAAQDSLNELVNYAFESNDADVAIHAQAARILFNGRAGRAAATLERDPALDSLTLGATVARWVSLFVAELAWAQCHLSGGQDGAAQTLALAELAPEHVSGPLVELVRSRLAADRGVAEAHVKAAIKLARSSDLALYELIAMRETFNYGAPSQSTVDRMVELAEEAGPGLATVYQAEAEAIAANDPVALTKVAKAAERYGAIGLAWEAHARAQIMHHGQGNMAEAFRSEIAYETVGRALPNQYAPIVEQLIPVLTAREREVVRGLSDGLTNREIAEQLYLSPKTVKSHLDRIYKRLDLTNRQDVARLAAERETVAPRTGFEPVLPA